MEEERIGVNPYKIGVMGSTDTHNGSPGHVGEHHFPGHVGLSDDTELAEKLIHDAEVACVPGTAFGAPGYLRMSFACGLETLEEAMNRLNRVLAA